MINRYAKSLKALLTELRECRKNPFENKNKWLYLQLKLLKRITYLESKIQDSKAKIIQLKRSLKTRNFERTKEESKFIKSRIEFQIETIEDYKMLICCFKSIADGIAFTFLDKFDIKPQNFKEKAGFISGKEGLKMELKALKHCYKIGVIAILNDLTSVLKYNDLTIVTSENFLSIEMKSSKLDNDRIQRQKDKSEKLFEYLDKGVTSELYGREGHFIRKGLELQEKHYSKRLNSLIDKSRKFGFAHGLMESGLIYVVCHAYENIEEKLDVVKEKYRLERPIFHSLNSNKFPGEGYYPFSLSLDIENYLDFLSGIFVVLIMLDFKHVELISNSKGFTAKYVDGKDWVLEFYLPDGTMALGMSYHLLGRIFTEFISPKQLFEDGFIQYHKMVKELSSAHDNNVTKQGD